MLDASPSFREEIELAEHSYVPTQLYVDYKDYFVEAMIIYIPAFDFRRSAAIDHVRVCRDDDVSCCCRPVRVHRAAQFRLHFLQISR
jgi:hypothetical protein